MSDTYIGWDGKSYPWPPPDGWYEASDGRWWAPGTGPSNDAGAGEGAAMSASETVSYSAAPDLDHSTGVDPAATAPFAPTSGQSPQATSGQPGAVDLAGQTARLPADAAASGRSATGHAPNLQETDRGLPSFGERDQSIEWEQPGEPTLEEGRGGLAKFGLVLLGVVAALAVAGGAYFFLTRDDSTDTASGDGSSATEDGTETGTTEATDGGETGTTTGDANSDESASTASTEEPASTDSSSTTETTTAVGRTAEVAAFRQILSDNGLTSDELSDDDIATFGGAFCVVAVTAEDEGDYQRLRGDATSDTDSSLTDEELALVIDAAVTVFCPDEASRLGINL